MDKARKHTYNVLRILLLAIVPLLSSCHDTPEHPAPESKEASRTVLVYMMATNTLSGDALDDLAEMKQAAEKGHIGDGRLLAYHVNYKGNPVLLEITAKGTDTLKVYNNPSMESLYVEQMHSVVEDAKKLAPAKEYGMVLWGHASGWFQDGIPQKRSYGCYEERPHSGNKKWMNVTDLASALRGCDLGFIYFDCCFMGAVEVLYEFRDVVPYIVASPTEIKAEGMPYHVNVECFFKPNLDLVQAARNYFEYYDYYYNNPDPTYDCSPTCPYTIAVYDMSHVEELAKVTRKIYDEAEATIPAGYRPQRMYKNSSYPFYDFKDYVEALAADNPELYAEWENVFNKLVMYTAHCEAIWGYTPIKVFGGLSTYIMDDVFLPSEKNYNTLSWYADVASALK